MKQVCRGGERQVRRVIGKRPDLKRHTRSSPARMHTCRDRIQLMMNVDSEVKQTAGNENARQLAGYLSRRLCMIDHVVAKHDVETLVRKRQRLTNRRNRLRPSLPAREQAPVTNREWIDADSMLRSEV